MWSSSLWIKITYHCLLNKMENTRTLNRSTFHCFLYAIFSIWILTLPRNVVQGEVPPTSYLPYIWRAHCEADWASQALPASDFLTSTQPPLPTSSQLTALGGKLINVTCTIPNTDNIHWKFLDLRQWQLSRGINANSIPANRSVQYVINVHCSNGANVSLPWPMKTEGVIEIHVDNCGLVDRDILYQNPMVAQIGNELRVLKMRDCISVVDMFSITDILQNSNGDSINVSSAFDCGQDSTLEVFIRSNFTLMSIREFRNFRYLHSNHGISSDADIKNEGDKYVKPEDRLVTDAQSLISDHKGIDIDKSLIFENASTIQNVSVPPFLPELDILEFMRKIMNTHSKCSYKKLKFQDESMTSDSFKYLLQFLAYGSEYPVLEVMNYSMVGLTAFPRGLQQWRLHFPRLRYVDLSHNSISQVMVEDFAFHPDTPTTIFNVRYNNITVINMDVLKSWTSGGNSHVDARYNPIHCDCSMRSFIPFLQNSSAFTGKLKQYEYIRVLKCQSPPSLKGRELYTLSLSSLSCPTVQSQSGWIIGLSIILAVFIAFTVVLFRFKAEIRILLYTRLNVRLPWDVDSQRNTKQYDAFVSYSNEDAKWVYQNIAAFLESHEPKDGESRNSHNLKTNGHPKNENNNSTNNKGNALNGRFKLCLHQRDFIAGMTIMDNILECIEASRHTIIIMSPSFMRSHWAMEELRQAYRQSLVEKTRHLIVVLLEKISEADMDPLIKRCCKTFTYLDVNDHIFKDRLIFSLTTKDRGARRRDRYANANTQDGKQTQNVESPFSYDNQTYEAIDRPSPPSRELSNMSSSSNIELVQSF